MIEARKSTHEAHLGQFKTDWHADCFWYAMNLKAQVLICCRLKNAFGSKSNFQTERMDKVV